MEPVAIANSLVTLLIPIMAKGMGDLANSAFHDVYLNIKQKLSTKTEGKNVVERFEKNPTGGAEDFQALLARHLNDDHELMGQLRDALDKSTAYSSLTGEINAKNVVVAQKIDNLNMS